MATGDTEATPVDEDFASSLVEQALIAYNTHDAEGFVGLMAEDVVVEHSAAPAPMRGRAEVSAFYADTWKTFPDLRLKLLDGPFFHLHAPRISVNWIASGLAPTGERVEFDVREIAEIRNGFVSRVRIVVGTPSAPV
ncbi:MAG: nuclear transport factor 2 family protein [Mycobacterium sp.]|nr:nuclear transport factor 2 family protein [Mycobacterium sp.]